MKAEDFDRFLSENSVKSDLVIMHPTIWNGYWSVVKRPKHISKLFRFLGRKLKNRRLYWVGLSLCWVYGLKTWKEFEGIEPEDIFI